jgi:hypothetical protein
MIDQKQLIKLHEELIQKVKDSEDGEYRKITNAADGLFSMFLYAGYDRIKRDGYFHQSYFYIKGKETKEKSFDIWFLSDNYKVNIKNISDKYLSNEYWISRSTVRLADFSKFFNDYEKFSTYQRSLDGDLYKILDNHEIRRALNEASIAYGFGGTISCSEKIKEVKEKNRKIELENIILKIKEKYETKFDLDALRSLANRSLELKLK